MDPQLGTQMATIGFIGLGNMGRPMADHSKVRPGAILSRVVAEVSAGELARARQAIVDASRDAPFRESCRT